MTLNEEVAAIQQAKRDIVALIDHAIVVLKGSLEFRTGVEALLVGTPFEAPKPDEYDFEGLYGRLRNALQKDDTK